MSMDSQKKELKKLAGSGIMLMALALTIAGFNSGLSKDRAVILASDEWAENRSTLEIIDENIEAEVVDEEGKAEKARYLSFVDQIKDVENYIIIPKPDGKQRIATITENYVYHTIFLDIEGDLTDFYHPDKIKRIAGEKTYEGEPEVSSMEPYLMAYLNDKVSVGEEEENAFDEEKVRERKMAKDSDPLINIKKSRVVGSINGTRLSLTCNRIYVPELFEDDTNYYIFLKRPKDVYEKIIVLDAGHGGRHPGTVSFDGKIIEKDTTLKVLLFLKELFDENKDIKVYYSRVNDATVYLRPRADLANETEADFFVSIHNNAFLTRYAYGTEVLYNEKIKNPKIKANRLAEILLENITQVLNSRSRGIRGDSEKYVLGHTNMISALIEIGYLTNDGDLSYILDDEKMRDCAKAIYDSILQVYEESEN